jgi:hypothetical protein
MKAKFKLIGCLLLACSAAWAQEKRRLDWQKFSNSIGETKIVEPVQFGKFTVFQIDNINKFLYKVEMSGKSFELQTPIPSELQTLFRLSSADLEKTAKAKKAEEAVAEIGGAIPPMKETSDEVERAVTVASDNVSAAEKELEEREGVAKNAAEDVAKANSAQKAAAKRTAKAADGEVENARSQLEKSKALAENKEELDAILKEIVKQCAEYLEISKVVATEIFDLRRIRNKLVTIAQLDESFSEINGRIPEAGLPSPGIKNNYFQLKESYQKLEALYESAATAAEAANASKVQKDRIEKSSGKIEKADELIDEEALLGLLNDVDFLLAELTNKNNFIAVAPPVQMDGDFVNYTVNITPTSTRALAAHRSPMEFRFDVPTRGGLKVDFSVGPVVSFGKGSRDFRYYREADAASGKFKLKRLDNRNDISPSLAALMHFYPRTGRNAAFGGLFGVGAGFQAISDVTLSLFTGVTYVLGKRQKIMLNGGLSYLRVDRLKTDQYAVGGTYDTANVGLEDVTEKVFKASPFLSITYNLASRVEN